MTDGGLQVELACEITFEVLRYEDVLAEPAVEFLDELLSSLVSRQVFFRCLSCSRRKDFRLQVIIQGLTIVEML